VNLCAVAGFLQAILPTKLKIELENMDDKPTRTGASWLVYLLGVVAVGAIVAAVLVVGPASGSQASVTRTARAAEGVVQSTVSGSGNLQPASQLNLGFRTSGTVTDVYVKQGQQVVTGQLLATLDPQSAEVTLEQSKAALLSAEANLAREEETEGEGSAQRSTSNGSGGSSESGGSSGSGGSGGSSQHAGATGAKQPEEQAKATEEVSAATRAANLASARATVSSDRLTVKSDEQAVADTKLYAPEDGTIVSLSGQVGEVVAASGTTKATSSASSSSSGSNASGAGTSGSAGTGRTDTGASGGGSSGSSASSGTGSSGSSSAPFAVLSDLASMQLVAPLSESEVGEVKAGQPATVTVEALNGAKLAATVSEVAILSTGGSGAVSYDVAFTLDQTQAGLKPGMSATAEVIVEQAEGVNVPTSAIAGGAVTVIADGKQERRRVVTGLAGNSSTIVLSGLKAGEEVLLPTLSSGGSSPSGGIASRLGRLAGAGGLGGAGLDGLAGGGGPALFRGGG
jgi:multidrug efflux pump subunit AcrA (membrane-fusion protein)